MKKLIMIMTVVAGVAAFAACEAKQEAKADAAQVESLAALKARKAAESCGCTVEAWNAMAAAKVFGDLNGAFVPPDKLADPIIDACAAHVQRLIRFFAGR